MGSPRVRRALALAVLLLAGCGEAVPPAPTPEQALLLKPADARLASLYEGSCKACHASPVSGAPMVHDRRAWDPRWRQGMPVLLDHTIQGFGAMPASGQCAACTPDDFEALIGFMAGRDGQ